MAKRTKQQDLNKYSGPVERCAWPDCDKSTADFHITRVGVLCHSHAWSVFEAIDESRVLGATQEQVQARFRRWDELDAEAAERKRLSDERGTQPGWVYYVRVGDRVKIGYSTDVKRRMKAYPPDSHLLAVHPGTQKLETDMHQRFAGSRAAGREWFRETPDLTEHIGQVVDQFGEPTHHRYYFRTDAQPLRHARSV